MKYHKNIGYDEVFFELFYDKMNTVSAVFNVLGWFHTRKWTQKEDALKNCVERLIRVCLKQLSDGKEMAECGGGGIVVRLWIEEDELLGELMIEI
jgi:hypothetical protein